MFGKNRQVHTWVFYNLLRRKLSLFTYRIMIIISDINLQNFLIKISHLL